jgi:hypothetical protein
LADATVGPRCTVAWRYRENGVHRGGGGQLFFSGVVPDASSGFLPTMKRGRDLVALVDALLPSVRQMLATRPGSDAPPALDLDEMNAALARLPSGPNEKLY